MRRLLAAAVLTAALVVEGGAAANAATFPAGGSTVPSVSDMSELSQLRLQMVMDRRAKLLETLSNILKRTSSASATIIGNLK